MMNAHRNASLISLGMLLLAAACGKKDEQPAVQGPETTQAAPAAAPAPATAAANCDLITAADVQEATGKPVQGPTVNKTNASVCEFKVADMGIMNFVSKIAGASERPDVMMAELNKRNIATSEHPGLGDRSFFASPGYNMTQLNSFKGPNYVIITLMVPGATEAEQKAAAVKVMTKALTRL